MKLRNYLILLLMCLITNFAFAAEEPAPLAMLKQTSDTMLNTLKKHRAEIKNNPNYVQRIVTQVLLPHVDLDNMSKAVVGRNYWSQATPQQKNQFKQEFTNSVIRTYATAISSYNEEKITFAPMRGFASGQSQVQVNSQIVRANGQVIPVSYRLSLKNGQWMVYDFSVEGVSLVQSYQSQFSGVLSQSGFEGLLKRLQQRNQGN